MPSANRILISIQNLKFSSSFIDTIFYEIKKIEKFNQIEILKLMKYLSRRQSNLTILILDMPIQKIGY